MVIQPLEFAHFASRTKLSMAQPYTMPLPAALYQRVMFTIAIWYVLKKLRVFVRHHPGRSIITTMQSLNLAWWMRVAASLWAIVNTFDWVQNLHMEQCSARSGRLFQEIYLSCKHTNLPARFIRCNSVEKVLILQIISNQSKELHSITYNIIVEDLRKMGCMQWNWPHA